MKSFNQFLSEENEGGTYVSVAFSKATNQKLKMFAESLNLKPIDRMHTTIVYSPIPLDIKYETIPLTGTAKITGIKYLGELTSDWRAVVLELHSKLIKERYDFYVKEHGYVSEYDEFIQHVSLAYSPPEGLDLTKVKLPDFELEIVSETTEALSKPKVDLR